MLTTLKIVLLLLNLLLIGLLAFFVSPLRWDVHEDRASIVGFACMIVIIAFDAIMIVLT